MHSNFREAASQARLAAEVLLDVALSAEATKKAAS
jgi:hypothetical protein